MKLYELRQGRSRDYIAAVEAGFASLLNNDVDGACHALQKTIAEADEEAAMDEQLLRSTASRSGRRCRAARTSGRRRVAAQPRGSPWRRARLLAAGARGAQRRRCRRHGRGGVCGQRAHEQQHDSGVFGAGAVNANSIIGGRPRRTSAAGPFIRARTTEMTMETVATMTSIQVAHPAAEGRRNRWPRPTIRSSPSAPSSAPASTSRRGSRRALHGGTTWCRAAAV